jgi:hypothetical protein
MSFRKLQNRSSGVCGQLRMTAGYQPYIVRHLVRRSCDNVVWSTSQELRKLAQLRQKSQNIFRN